MTPARPSRTSGLLHALGDVGIVADIVGEQHPEYLEMSLVRHMQDPVVSFYSKTPAAFIGRVHLEREPLRFPRGPYVERRSNKLRVWGHRSVNGALTAHRKEASSRSELAGVQQRAGDVVDHISEAPGAATQVSEPAVDRLGKAGIGVHGRSTYASTSGAGFRRRCSRWLRPRRGARRRTRRTQPLTLIAGHQGGADTQYSADAVKRLAGSFSRAARLLLDALTKRLRASSDKATMWMGFITAPAPAQLLAGGGLVPGEPVHRENLDPGPSAPARV